MIKRKEIFYVANEKFTVNSEFSHGEDWTL